MSMTIKDAWLSAEKTCFNQLVTRTASREGWDAFRGYLPADRNAWMFTSGGVAGSFVMDRLAGTTPLYCTLGFNAKVVCRFAERDDCLTFAGKVLTAFSQTTNFKQIGNVLWLRLTDLPGEPVPLEINEDGLNIWIMEIPMEMIVSTNTEF
jgi:hypothetical protein